MFAKTVSKLLLPTLERDLTKAVSAELASASKMTDCFLAPTVYGYEKTSASSGMGHATSALQQRETTTSVFEKVHYPVPKQGLFE
mmetsp:Transcript_991/g.2120  ORF Transcript_991/g.2120 Transcript_991/m.2120 type:complete len:85 (-) Transcript_991:457-711(-)|eukprot:CAMPEP_0172366308 /NCGR_PEP_ID=MMETSP1060-20121228/14753_1 /TAXON_ID=37318 /ORGANISM="Pseudo-nitzschia pungens, Strain cf. cingulata" /LENGTH=84 /DNA_ID=CAMNT_0013090111 /DNA_START=90 /DNA_END=344 /DNA_ORIENTATION=-